MPDSTLSCLLPLSAWCSSVRRPVKSPRENCWHWSERQSRCIYMPLLTQLKYLYFKGGKRYYAPIQPPESLIACPPLSEGRQGGGIPESPPGRATRKPMLTCPNLQVVVRERHATPTRASSTSDSLKFHISAPQPSQPASQPARRGPPPSASPSNQATFEPCAGSLQALIHALYLVHGAP